MESVTKSVRKMRNSKACELDGINYSVSKTEPQKKLQKAIDTGQITDVVTSKAVPRQITNILIKLNSNLKEQIKSNGTISHQIVYA